MSVVTGDHIQNSGETSDDNWLKKHQQKVTCKHLGRAESNNSFCRLIILFSIGIVSDVRVILTLNGWYAYKQMNQTSFSGIVTVT